jgi:hypothetical protein
MSTQHSRKQCLIDGVALFAAEFEYFLVFAQGPSSLLTALEDVRGHIPLFQGRNREPVISSTGHACR